MKTRKTLQYSLGGIFLLGIIVYSLFQARFIIGGPSLIVENPINGSTVTESALEIRRTATQASFITVNGNQIFTDENGVFNETITLFKGYNMIVVATKDKFDRQLEERISIIYK